MNRLLGRIPVTFLGRVGRWLPKSGSILDAGCGTGALVGDLARSGQAFIGVDIDLAKVVKARARGVYSSLVVASIDELPFKDCAFDTVLSIEVVEHLPKGSGERGLDEFFRVSRGAVVLTTRNEEGVEPVEAKIDPHQAHKSMWTAYDLRGRGFHVYGLGLRWSWGPGGMALKRGSSRILGVLVSVALGPLVAARPEWAAGLLAVSQDRREPARESWRLHSLRGWSDDTTQPTPP